MLIDYRFISNTEPSDEQLHLLMREVALEAKNKAQKSDELFKQQFEQLLKDAKMQFAASNAQIK